MTTAYLTPTETAMYRVLESEDKPIPLRELHGRATGARYYYGDSRSHLTSMRRKGVPIECIKGQGYYLTASYTPPPKPKRESKWRYELVVHVPPEPMFAVLTACYEAMWVARAKKVAA